MIHFQALLIFNLQCNGDGGTHVKVSLQNVKLANESFLGEFRAERGTTQFSPREQVWK